MKVLLVVASKHGSTREIGEAIAQELRDNGVEAEVCDVRDPYGLTTCDAVIFGSAIYAGSWPADARELAVQLRPLLAKMPLWVFSSGPLGADEPQPQVDTTALAAPLDDIPVREHKVFAGKLDPEELGFGERLLTKMVGAPQGDFRDWDEIRAWARQIAAELSARVAVTN